MAIFSSYPRQDAFETTLPTDIDAVVTTIGLNLAPSFTLASGTCYAVIDYDKPTTKIEIISFTGVSGSNLTGVTRGVAKYEGGASTAQTHASGAKVIISDNWQTWKDIATAINSKLDTTGGTVTGSIDFSGAVATFRTPNLTTVEKLALASPANGMLVFDTTLGELQQYNGGSWLTFAAGSTQPNASETVAGKVEQATSAEALAATDVGSTGASLFVVPSLINAMMGALVPTGTVLNYAGAAAPTGFLLCDGASYLRASYANLFTAISTTFGSADGTHFNVPDMRGRTAIGAGTGTGGGSAGTGLPTGGTALTARVLGAWKGEETHALITAELAAHTHTYDKYITYGGALPSAGTSNSGSLSSTASGSNGSGTAHENMQPVMTLNYIIKI